MAECSNVIKIKQWSSQSRSWVVKENWVAKNITWYTFYITFKPWNDLNTTNDSTAIIDKAMTINNAVNGEISFTITESESDNPLWRYVGAISYVNSAAPTWSQFTEQLWYLYLEILPSVNKAI